MANRATIADIIALLSEHSPTGFAVALHIRFTSPTFLFQSYPPAWSEEYTGRGLHLQDPNVIWGFTNTGSIRWSELEKQDPAGVIAGARRHGMKYGVAWAVLRDDTRSVAGFSRGDREFTDEEVAALGEILTRLHDQTRGSDALKPADFRALREMSIRMTHD